MDLNKETEQKNKDRIQHAFRRKSRNIGGLFFWRIDKINFNDIIGSIFKIFHSVALYKIN